jgi:myosin heavy subunit
MRLISTLCDIAFRTVTQQPWRPDHDVIHDVYILDLFFVLAMLVGDKGWVPASLTQARYSIPGELMYGNGRAVWIPVVVKSVESNGSANVVLEWDGSVKINAKFKDIQPRSVVESMPDDLIQLEYPNEGSILYLLGDHFRHAQFLCRLGRSFIWINPMYRNVHEIGCHSNSLPMMTGRLNSTSSSSDIFSIAEEARKVVSENLTNLSVIFRGASGSGKTELSKFSLQYLLYAQSPRHDKTITETMSYIPLGHGFNPLLISNSCEVSKSTMAGILVMDAFGSSPTEKNPTSSRLMRISRLQYDLSK